MAVVCASLLLVACGQRELPEVSNVPVRPLEKESVLVDAPLVQRDLNDIKKDKTLRVLLRHSSSSYHVLRGQEYGFEYELVRRFARAHDLQLQVVMPRDHYSLFTVLNRGDVDLIAAPLLEREASFANVMYTAPYNSTHLELVMHSDKATSVATAEDLAGVAVATRRWSNEEYALLELQKQGIDVRMVYLSPQMPGEELMRLVANGTYDAALVPGNIVAAAQTYLPELESVLPVGGERDVRWAVRQNSSELAAALNEFLSSHLAENRRGEFVSSRFHRVLQSKYFADSNLIRGREDHPFRPGRTGRVSPYDELFQTVGSKYDIDWRLLASMAYQESRFDPSSKSFAGAVGLLQVMPRTAGLPEDELYDADVNVEVAGRHFKSLWNNYHFLDDKMRLAFSLAAYNAGQGHLDDARMLAIMRGEDPNQWPSVRKSLLLLLEPEQYRRVRYGYVRGTETTKYVDDIMRRYEIFQNLLAATRPGPEPEPIHLTQSNQSIETTTMLD